VGSIANETTAVRRAPGGFDGSPAGVGPARPKRALSYGWRTSRSGVLHTIAFIPARGGSKGLPGKNLALVGGRSLVARAVGVAREVPGIDEVVVSSDDPEILREAAGCGAVVEHRAPNLAGDATPMLEVLREFIGRRPDVDAVVLLQPTSPLRRAEDARACLAALASADSATTVTPSEHPLSWSFELDPQRRLVPVMGWDAVATRRQAAPATYRLNGAVYAIRGDALRRGAPLVCETTVAVVMPVERSVDIDREIDLLLARLLADQEAERNSGSTGGDGG
jgi:CMP-N,N'-diacetyllegionaminic acid synthase